MTMHQYWFIHCDKRALVTEDINNGKVSLGCMGTLYYRLNFSVDLSILKQKLF